MLKNFLLSLIFLLFFLITVPHVIGIRNGIFYLLFLSTLVMIWKYKKDFLLCVKYSELKIIYFFLLLTSMWILFNSVVISHEILWSLDEFRGQWLTPVTYFFMGSIIAFYTIKKNVISKELLLTVLFYSMFVHILYIDLVALDNFLDTKNLIQRYGGLTNSPVLANYLTNILFAFIISELIYRKRSKKNILKISNYMLFIILGLTLLSSLIESMRNGSAALFFMSIMGIYFFLNKNQSYSKKVKFLISFGIILVLSIPIIYNLKNDTRWATLIETIPIAIDTKTNKYWINKKSTLPRLSSGQVVGGSNYLRVAYASEGTKLIVENPLGIGFGRNAFGHALEIKYNKNSVRGFHSHSSLIDFTLGVGFIGLILWLIFIFLIMKKAIYFCRENVSFFSMLTFFLTTGFFTRSLVDSNMRDHMFLQFMFLLGISLVLMFNERKIMQFERNNFKV